MPLTKALIINRDEDPPLPIPVMFNPPEYRIERTNEFAEVGVPGLGSSVLQFVRGSAQTLSMDLFFDATDLGVDVRTITELVVGLTSLNAKTHAPPRLMFVWGSLIFPCVLESVLQHFDYFNAAGIPLRATLTVTLKECNELQDLLSSTPLESADKTKGRVVTAGDTLQGIAAREYDDPRQWRLIAQATNIDNPLTIRPGLNLIIPALRG
jgi:nucleoid-associated protein YgaU